MGLVLDRFADRMFRVALVAGAVAVAYAVAIIGWAVYDAAVH